MSAMHTLALLCCLVAGAIPASSRASSDASLPVLVLNDTNEPPYTNAQRDGYVDVIATEAFRRAGLVLRLVKQPPERGLRSANAGEIDGDLTRIAGLDTHYPNLVRVPEKLMDWELSAFGKTGSLAPGWETLPARPVGHIKGWKVYEQKLAGAPAVVATADAAQLFRLLAAGRIETALYERWLGLALMRELKLTGLAPHEPPLARREMFIYLHQRHTHRVPALAKALADMKADGFYRRAQAQRLDPYARGVAR